MLRPKRWRKPLSLLLTGAMLLPGCADLSHNLHYLGPKHEEYYKGEATNVEFPAVCSITPETVQSTLEPHTVRDREHYEVRRVTLAEAIQTSLQNAQVIRTNGQFLSGGNGLLLNPNGVPSVWDPAIQETGVLFGGRGVEAALAAFDANFTTSMIWGRNELVQNNIFGGGLGPGAVLTSETAQFQSALAKQFAYGGSLELQHNINYLGTNVPTNLFESVYTGNMTAIYRQPLLAGAGSEYTRIAGPISSSFGGITGVSQGVVISRINNDLTICQFELALQNLVRDVEEAYWDLYLAYRNFNTASTARDSAQGTWDLADKQAPAILLPADEAQARDQLYAARSAVLNTRSNLFTVETRLRRLMGLPVNDGTILQPADEPATAEVIPDWYANLTEALMQRVELRQQKWNIKSLELQLVAAKSLTQPRLDFVASWQVNGFGDQLLPYETQDAPAPDRLKSYYGTLINGDEQGWNVGVQMNIPIGFRQAHAQVRNYELRLSKARKVLAEQEKEIAQELAVSFQEAARAYSTAVENFNRYQAAADNVEKLRPAAGATLNVDVVLRAQERLAAAEVAYFTSVVDYNRALANLQYRKGTILAYNNVSVREGPWVADAYDDARRRGEASGYAWPAKDKITLPREFASPYPMDAVEFTAPGAAMMNQPAGAPPTATEPTPAPQNPGTSPGTTPQQPGPSRQETWPMNPTAPKPPRPGEYAPQPQPGGPADPFSPRPMPPAGTSGTGPVTQASWVSRVFGG